MIEDRKGLAQVGNKGYIDIRIWFDEEQDWDDEVWYFPSSAAFLDSDIPDEFISNIAESAGQSDKYTVGVTNAVLNALGGGEYEVDL